MIRIVIADDHALMREGLRCIFRDIPTLGVVAELTSGFEVLAQARVGGFDVLLLEPDIPGCSGLDLLRRLASETPDVRTLVLAEGDAGKHALPAMAAGARGFLEKSASVGDLVAAIHCVASGRIYADGFAGQRPLQPDRQGAYPAHAMLSDREYVVFAALAMGCSVSRIAFDMGMSVKTVSVHKARMMEKLGMDTLSEVVRYAIEQRLDAPHAR
jgi:DNA-binding NarL/FixJ family response regulator